MFKKFSDKEHVSNVNQAKSSAGRAIAKEIREQMPYIEDYLDHILPKKGLKIIKCHDHIEMLPDSSGLPIFFKQRNGPWFPTLRLLHQYPFLLPPMQVDRGAIKFVLSGANIMCPGLTSPGAKMTKVDQGTVVAIMAEGKQHALAIGLTKLSTDKILEVNKGIGVDTIHYLNDGLWHMKHV